VRADQVEVGLRGTLAKLAYDVSLYRLVKQDDILSYRDTATNITQVVNAGETLHRGVEAGLGIPLGGQFRLDLSASYAKHTYEEWVIPGTADFSGKEMESAPRVIANTRLSWLPAANQRVQLEWLHLGSYWMDQANSAKYDGHDLLNLRANWSLGKDVNLFGSIQNLSDERYAESASISSSTQVFSPGLPRTAYLGVEAKW
jgi:outer membrane receptor protein involved in Fe transport